MSYILNASHRHASKSLNEALGYTDEESALVIDKIFFVFFQNSLEALRFSEMDIELPKEKTSQSKLLVDCLQLCQEPKEYDFCLLSFKDCYNHGKEIFAKWHQLNKLRTEGGAVGEILGGVIGIMETLQNKKNEKSSKDREESKNTYNQQFSSRNLMKKIEMVRDSSSWEDYYSKLSAIKFTEDVISKALNSDE